MTETKHTPGPWSVNRNIGRKSEIGIMSDNAPCIIATMSNAKAWPMEAEANAEFIASAPAMAARIVELETAIREALTLLGGSKSAVKMILDAALDAAEGESDNEE